MARYDVYKVNYGPIQYLVDVQSDVLNQIETRVVVPLFPKTYKNERMPRLTPLIEFGTEKLFFIPANITTVSVFDLKDKVDNLERYHREITDALDFLFQGF